MTLVSIAASSRLQPGLEKEVDYLVKEKGADPKITDINGFNAVSSKYLFKKESIESHIV